MLHRWTTMRDLAVFLVFFGIALLLGIVGPGWAKDAAAALFVVAYVGYVWLSIRRGGQTTEEGELTDLYFDPSKQDPPNNFQIAAQTLAGLAAIVGGAHLFVIQIEHFAAALGVSALLLALVIAPLATELPEKANGFIWVRSGKDPLALGNITGRWSFSRCCRSRSAWRSRRGTLPWPRSSPRPRRSAGGLLVLLTLGATSRLPLHQVCGWGVLYVGAIVVIVAVV